MTRRKNTSIVLICIDHRFWLDTLLVFKEKYGDFDLIAMAGAAKNLLSPGSGKDSVLENIKISVKLHHANRIILANHLDCGAYGGSKKFKSREKEISFHSKELKKAKNVVKKKFPKLKVETVIIDGLS